LLHSFLNYKACPVARSIAVAPALRPFDKLRAGRLRMYGSMVLYLSKFVVWAFAQTTNKK
jgi:hypothetical protein